MMALTPISMNDGEIVSISITLVGSLIQVTLTSPGDVWAVRVSDPLHLRLLEATLQDWLTDQGCHYEAFLRVYQALTFFPH